MQVISKIQVLKNTSEPFVGRDGKTVDYKACRFMSEDGEVFEVPYAEALHGLIESKALGTATFDVFTKTFQNKTTLKMKMITFVPDSE